MIDLDLGKAIRFGLKTLGKIGGPDLVQEKGEVFQDEYERYLSGLFQSNINSDIEYRMGDQEKEGNNNQDTVVYLEPDDMLKEELDPLSKKSIAFKIFDQIELEDFVPQKYIDPIKYAFTEKMAEDRDMEDFRRNVSRLSREKLESREEINNQEEEYSQREIYESILEYPRASSLIIGKEKGKVERVDRRKINSDEERRLTEDLFHVLVLRGGEPWKREEEEHSESEEYRGKIIGQCKLVQSTYGRERVTA